MKTTFLILTILFLLFIIYFFILGINSKSKTIPGLIDGRLSNCPDSPNCICTENKDHTDHYMSPINITEHSDLDFNPFLTLKRIVIDIGGTIKIENENYIAAMFSSSIFGFVDDFEIRIDKKNNMIHLRSASRVGRSDFGVNKKRIELVKKRYNAASFE